MCVYVREYTCLLNGWRKYMSGWFAGWVVTMVIVGVVVERAWWREATGIDGIHHALGVLRWIIYAMMSRRALHNYLNDMKSLG